MILDLYKDYCKHMNIEFDEDDYELFYGGWMACRSVVLSLVSTLDDEEDGVGH